MAPSRYLGHYVAANLAARHDIRVRLAPGVSGGVTATVHLPPDLLVRDAALAAQTTATADGPPPQAPRAGGLRGRSQAGRALPGPGAVGAGEEAAVELEDHHAVGEGPQGLGDGGRRPSRSGTARPPSPPARG